MLKLKEGFPEHMTNIVNLVNDKSLNHLTLPSEIEKIAREYILEKDITRNEIRDCSFFSIENFEGDLTMSEEIFEFMCTCHRLAYNIYDSLSGKINFGKLTRKISPPLEAYEYTAFNKYVKGSGRSYGLLFE